MLLHGKLIFDLLLSYYSCMLFAVVHFFASPHDRPFPFLSELRAGFTTVLAFFLGGFPCLAYQNLARACRVVLDDYIRRAKVKAKGAWPLVCFSVGQPRLWFEAFKVNDLKTVSLTKSLLKPEQVNWTRYIKNTC